jgi:hypothetical protein
VSVGTGVGVSVKATGVSVFTAVGVIVPVGTGVCESVGKDGVSVSTGVKDGVGKGVSVMAGAGEPPVGGAVGEEDFVQPVTAKMTINIMKIDLFTDIVFSPGKFSNISRTRP